MEKVILRENACKGCGLCVSVCPRKLLRLDLSRVNAKGYNPAVFSEGGCTSCAFCAAICPDLVISVNK
ncbi:MAG: 4Fe-4S dicluster domain-containing protein [Clostridiales bacterium]|nr:4Fe-4S dicluster domain-containing protein [Clostridiales bacterium]